MVVIRICQRTLTNESTIFDDSWAPPKLTQQFRIVATDNPTPPASAVMHVWV